MRTKPANNKVKGDVLPETGRERAVHVFPSRDTFISKNPLEIIMAQALPLPIIFLQGFLLRNPLTRILAPESISVVEALVNVFSLFPCCSFHCRPGQRTVDDLEIIYEELLHIKALSHLSTTVSCLMGEHGQGDLKCTVKT